MNPNEVRETIFRVLAEVAPECDPRQLDPVMNLRDQLDLDSMDFQKVVIRLHEELQIEIPERDYPRLLSIEAATSYLATAKRA